MAIPILDRFPLLQIFLAHRMPITHRINVSAQQAQ